MSVTTRDLTKWPRLLVVGDPVTEEQANEVILRTTNWHLCTNDRAFERAVYAEIGVPADQYGWPIGRALSDFEASIGCLNLHYLANARIASSYIGGPHGWCDWDGTIGCSTYNIGKWPAASDVDGEWRAIAAAFPFLRLRAQLIADEGEAPEVAAEWSVRDGSAELVEPGERIAKPNGPDLGAFLASLHFGAAARERGVSMDRLREALVQVEATP